MVEYSQPETPTDELEAVKMFGVDTGERIDLERVVVVGGIFEEAVGRVKHLVREEEEPFPTGRTGTHQPRLPREKESEKQGKTYLETPP